MIYQELNALQKNRLPLELKPIFIGQLLILDTLKNSAYSYTDFFKKELSPNEGITSEFISYYAQKHGTTIFIHRDDYLNLHSILKNEVLKHTRALSIGDPLKNAKKHVNLLSMQMANLYEDPYNDEVLMSQFQSSKNFCSLLLRNKKIHKEVYFALSKSHYHYTIAQPLLTSILLLSFLQELKVFSEKEMEALFLTSYFKDIGMCFIPREKFEQSHLSEYDKKLFQKHADNSLKILKGRIPFNKQQLNLIKNHHGLNHKIQAAIHHDNNLSDPDFISGVESSILSAIDVLVAMTHKRPYRQALSYFDALDLLKNVLSEDYPQEFKTLVLFIKKLVSN